MRLHATLAIGGSLVALTCGAVDAWAQPAVTPAPLSEVGRRLEARYAEQLQTLRAECAATIPQHGHATPDAIENILADDGLDDRLVKYVVLHEATPQALARFAQQGEEQAHLVEKLLADVGLMKQMLVADGANAPREGRGFGLAAYGPAMKIYADIQQSSPKAAAGIFQRDVGGEPRTYGERDGTPAFWNAVALRMQRSIIDNAKTATLGALGEDLGEANEPTIAEKVLASPVTADDRKITYGKDGVVSIPAAASSTPSGNTQDVIAMQRFGGGMQVFCRDFFRRARRCCGAARGRASQPKARRGRGCSAAAKAGTTTGGFALPQRLPAPRRRAN